MSTGNKLCGRRGVLLLALLLMVLPMLGVGAAGPAAADSYERISGAGSTWSQNAMNQWIADVVKYGMIVDYGGGGSSYGRQQFLNGTEDFAASDIPFQFKPEDGSTPENPAPGSYAYMPITAGGTVFMYNLTINGQRVTNLRLSGVNITKIFTGVITRWNDPALQADNPGLALPNVAVVPVVRSDGSGSTAQFSLWMVNQHNDLWTAYCGKVGRANRCGATSYYPTLGNMIAQSGDLGVAGYVSQNFANGAIGYVQYSYAKNAGFPVAKMLNAANYYTEPTPENVAVSLLKADINRDPNSQDYLTQKLDAVYTDTDPRTYPLSSYSYLILPTIVKGRFNLNKGKTLAAFSYFAMCQGQQTSAVLGYSPMPINLVQASFDQIRKVPGAVVQNINIQQCNNPTFAADGTNKLADTAPMPPACDKAGPTQCTTATGGAHTPTPVSKGAGPGGTGGTGSGSGTGGTGGSGGTGSSNNSTGNGTGAAGTPGATTGPGGTTGTGDTSAAAQQQCADTGQCSGGGVALGQQASNSPQTLAAKSGWTSTQTLMVLAGLLTVGLVLAPGLASRWLGKRNPK